ncbi:MAG: hypothetical protein ABJD97_00530 [Betaproteobacteria bacterium]
MLKFLLPAALVLSVFPVLAEQSAAPLAPTAGACTSTNPTGGDIRVVTCTLPARRMHRFTVNFAGGHDDTSASLAATLDGQPATCDADSKTSLFGEDGDVSLQCRIAAAGGADTPHALVVTVLWSHAQYRDFVFAAE